MLHSLIQKCTTIVPLTGFTMSDLNIVVKVIEWAALLDMVTEIHIVLDVLTPHMYAFHGCSTILVPFRKRRAFLGMAPTSKPVNSSTDTWWRMSGPYLLLCNLSTYWGTTVTPWLSFMCLRKRRVSLGLWGGCHVRDAVGSWQFMTLCILIHRTGVHPRWSTCLQAAAAAATPHPAANDSGAVAQLATAVVELAKTAFSSFPIAPTIPHQKHIVSLLLSLLLFGHSPLHSHFIVLLHK